jgi:branched-chain amino acid transport system permease protein
MIELLLSQIANGLILGILYVLIAIGLTIIFGMMGIVNFAHGSFFALGAYLALSLRTEFGWWSVIFAPVIAGLVGVAIELALIRRVYDKEPLISLIVTFALALLLEAIIRMVWGSGGQPFNPPEFLNGIIRIGPVLLTKYRAAVFVTTVALLFGLWAFVKYTKFGRVLRAGSRDGEMVGLLGINLPRVMTAAFGIGIAFAAIAGVLAAPLWLIRPSMAEAAIMPAFVTVALGGLGSYSGAIVAGLAVGVTTAITIQFWPEASAGAMYALMALVLLVRPRGLFGEKWERFE